MYRYVHNNGCIDRKIFINATILCNRGLAKLVNESINRSF